MSDVTDYLDEVRRQINLERQLEPDYLFSKINVPKTELHPDLTRPKGLVMSIWDAITKKAPAGRGR